MKHIIKIKLLWLLACLCGLAACNKDKGNYDYIELNTVNEVTGISTSYTVELGEQLNISPVINTSLGNPNDFLYTWYYYETGTNTWKILQEGKDLDFKIDAPIGTPNTTYNCAYEVTNIETEITYRFIFTIHVAGAFGKGYVILSEKENGFNMSMLVLNSQNQFDLRMDILDATAPALQREGVTPYDILIFTDPTAPDPYNRDNSNRSVFLLTDHYTTRLKAEDFSWDSSYDISNIVQDNTSLSDNFTAIGKPIIAEQMKVGYHSVNGTPKNYVYIYVEEEDGNHNWYMYNTWPAWHFLGEPMNAIRTEESTTNGKQRYTPAPYISNVMAGTMYYNMENNRFYYQTVPTSANDFGTSNLYYTQAIEDESTSETFNFNDENEGVIYMGERFNGYGNSPGFAILKKADGNFSYIEYTGGRTLSELINPDYKLRQCTFNANTGIDNAKFIVAAPTPNNAYLYYVTQDNRVFYADVSGEQAQTVEITDEVIPEGYNEITAFTYMLPGTNGLQNAQSKSLAIATYNASLGKDTGGRIDFYVAPSISSGRLEKAYFEVDSDTGEQIEMSWSGFGRIVGLDYKP